jgi:isochorismate synthase
LLGGFAFAPSQNRDPSWSGFPDARLILPRLLLRQHGGAATLTLSYMSDGTSQLEPSLFGTLLRCTSAARTAEPPPRDYAVSSDGSPDDWARGVEECTRRIKMGALGKVVLARSCGVRSPSVLDAARLVARLRCGFPECATFWVRSGPASFVGATPELLLRVEGRRVHTAAIAGSAPRGSTSAHDEQLASHLMQSAKERSEHAFVVEAIRDALVPLCDELTISPEPELLRLANVQHLRTRIGGHRRAGRNILDLAACLHPSPAVAGQPRDEALRLIDECEHLDRGWYAGPIGWLDTRGGGELAVAIRSALLRGGEARLYAGAGIVAGSDPEAELNETRLKMQPILTGLLEV